MKRKMRRNQGASYASDTTGRNIPGRKVGPLCKCKRNKCWPLLQGRVLHTLTTSGIYGISTFKMHRLYIFLYYDKALKGYTRRKDQNLILLGEVACFRIMQN
jgi:hypothetical protein